MQKYRINEKRHISSCMLHTLTNTLPNTILYTSISIREYIMHNPLKWDLDSDNPKNLESI